MAKKKTGNKEPKQRGRPKENVADKVDYKQLAILCKKGFTDVELAEFYGVTERTITNWKKDKDFFSVLKENKELADETLVWKLWERANGYNYTSEKIFMPAGATAPTRVEYTEHCPPEISALKFWLCNRQPDKWKNRVENNIGASTETGHELTEAFKKMFSASSESVAASTN